MKSFKKFVTEDAKFEPRIRFNWGFWDGNADAEHNRTAVWSKNGKSHYDKVYEAGYWAGRAAAYDQPKPTTSDAAWQVFKTTTAKPSNNRPMFDKRY